LDDNVLKPHAGQNIGTPGVRESYEQILCPSLLISRGKVTQAIELKRLNHRAATLHKAPSSDVTGLVKKKPARYALRANVNSEEFPRETADTVTSPLQIVIRLFTLGAKYYQAETKKLIKRRHWPSGATDFQR